MQSALTKHYEDYYLDDREREWRTLCAVGKAKNITSLWFARHHDAPSSLVEFGCGDGAILEQLDKANFSETKVGLELSSSGIAAANKREFKSSPEFVLYDGIRSNFEDKQFKLAILSHVLEHVENPRMLLLEASRVAEYVYIEVPLELHSRTPQNFKPSRTGHINLFNQLILRHLAQSSELIILEEKVMCPELNTFTHQRSLSLGYLHWAFKTLALKFSPYTAQRYMTYHGCLLVTPKSQ